MESIFHFFEIPGRAKIWRSAIPGVNFRVFAKSIFLSRQKKSGSNGETRDGMKIKIKDGVRSGDTHKDAMQ